VPKSGDFVFLASVEKSEATESGGFRFLSRASTSSLDSVDHIILPSAIEDMRSQGRVPVTVGAKHEDTIVDPLSVIGFSVPSVDGDTEDFIVEGEIIASHPYAGFAIDLIKHYPEEVKVSVGGFVPADHRKEVRDPLTGKSRIEIEKFKLNHILLCRKDSALNQDTWVTAKAEGYGWEDAIFKAADSIPDSQESKPDTKEEQRRVREEELSAKLEGKSLGDLSFNEVSRKLMEALSSADNYVWVKDIWDGVAIVEFEEYDGPAPGASAGCYVVEFTVNGDQVSVGMRKPVHQAWVDENGEVVAPPGETTENDTTTVGKSGKGDATMTAKDKVSVVDRFLQWLDGSPAETPTDVVVPEDSPSAEEGKADTDPEPVQADGEGDKVAALETRLSELSTRLDGIVTALESMKAATTPMVGISDPAPEEVPAEEETPAVEDPPAEEVTPEPSPEMKAALDEIATLKMQVEDLLGKAGVSAQPSQGNKPTTSPKSILGEAVTAVLSPYVR